MMTTPIKLIRFRLLTVLSSILLLLFLFFSQASFGQVRFTVSGNIKDSKNGEELIGATVFVKELNTGNVTNAYGFYSITLPQGDYTLQISYIGYITQDVKVELNTNKKIDVQLVEEAIQVQEVEVRADKEDVDHNVRSTEMGVNRLEIKTIQSMPALLGEVDIIRSIQMTPGVSTVGEGASGFNVRGGGVDQNLILLDEANVFNSSHLFGLFSVFNADAVKDVKLVKGGIPAQYGGRLSSLLDIRMKDGNSKRIAGQGGVGTVSSRFTFEAPIIQDKSSFIISGRRSYADLFLRLSSDPELNQNILYFYDLSAKLNYRISPKDRIFVSGYFGRDVFRFGEDFQFDWGNATGTLRWNHLFSEKLFANFSFIYSDYKYSLGVPSGSQAFDWDSNIINFNPKADFSYYINPNHTFNFGVSGIYYNISPGFTRPLNDGSIFNEIRLDKQKAGEYAGYFDHEWNPSQKLSFQYGLRYSIYQLYGPGTYYEYVGEAGKRKEATNPQTYKNGETIVTYSNIEPRFSMRYTINESSSFKASYNRTAQYLHLISNTTAATPTDVWSPTTQNIKPETADQISLGYFRNFKNNTIEASAEVYYKEMNNQVDYIDGAETLLNEKLEGELLYGLGRSYGLELFVKKNSGAFTGWVAYTLSKSERKIEGINNNEWYNAKYDRTHNLSVVGIYTLNDRWSFSANFAYATGVSTTFPNAKYEVDGIIIPHNTDGVRNNFRVPSYHRLDIAATLEGRKRPNRRFSGSWVFSIYNLYARRNAFSIYFRQNEDNPQQTEAVRLSIFGSILPSVTYNFKF